MKRYIVTEEEMLARDRAAMALGAATIPGTAMSFMEANMDLETARIQTNSREVPEWATHFCRRATKEDWDQYSNEHVSFITTYPSRTQEIPT